MKWSAKKTIIVMMVTLLVAPLFSCAPKAKPAPPLTPVVMQLQWTHQAEFAGFYAADQNGYYTEEGLAVTFLPGGTNVDHLAAVQNGDAQFGTTSADALISARDQGKPLRAIAAVFRRSPTVFVTLADSGITRPQEFVGKKIRTVATTTVTLHAMTSFVGVSPSQYTEFNLPSDVAMFASGEVPVWGMFITGQAVAIKQAGYKINIIYPDNYGVHYYRRDD
jgi:NitT/TauT family transport system substrate-binding protein